MNKLLTAIALTIALPAMAHAAEPAPAPDAKQVCCEKMKADGKECCCCKEHAKDHAKDHAGHDQHGGHEGHKR